MSASIWEPGATVPVVDPNSTVKVEAFVATAAQTLFNLTLFTYVPSADALEVYKNGLKLPKADVTETSTSSFTIAACVGGEVIEAVGNTVVASASGSAAAALVSQNAAAASAAAALVSELAADVSADAAAASAVLAVMSWESNWVTATNYQINDGVKATGGSYICRIAHTSGTFAADLAAVKWQLLAADGTNGTGAGDMVAANNLSDVSNVVTARSNLGLGTAATAAASTFATALNPVITGVAELPDGSAAAPSLTNTGDTNTGLYFPAADTVAVSAGGVEQLRVSSATLNLPVAATRITGDFSNATVANRVLFQTSTANGSSTVGFLPNGTSQVAQAMMLNNSDPTNASTMVIRAGATENWISSAITGTGTYLPMTFYTGGAERLRIDASGFLGVNTGALGVTLDQAGTLRHTILGPSTSTTVADGSGGLTLLNSQTTTGNFSSLAFAAITGANASYFASGLIQVQHGVRTNGEYHAGSIIFSTSSGSNAAPVERARIDQVGNVVATSATGRLGYGTGAGGTVTQATSKSTAVTLNKPCGQITMHNAALAAGAVVGFVFNNSLLNGADILSICGGGGAVNSGNYNYWTTVASGSSALYVKNISAGSLSESIVINFAIIKGATS